MPGHVQPRERHDAARNRLVAADEHDEAVEAVAARDELDRVGDHLAADERRAHALGAHRDAVGNRDGVELHRRAAGRADAGFDVLGQRAQVQIARADLDPGVGDADERLLQIRVGEAGAFEHRARGRAARACRQWVVSVSAHACISKESGTAFVAEAGLQLGYEPSMRSIGANSARCASARAHARSSRAAARSSVEQVFPLAVRNRPRFELRQVDAAQREHAERLEQRARLVGQREHDRRLVGRGARQRPPADDEEARGVVLVILNRRLERRRGRTPRRRAPTRWPPRPRAARSAIILALPAVS